MAAFLAFTAPAQEPPKNPLGGGTSANATVSTSANVSATTPPPGKPAPHVFNLAEGKSVTGEIINVVDDTVFIKAAGAPLYRVAIAALNAEDQKIVRAWIAHEISSHRDAPFRIALSRVRTSPETVEESASTTTTWQEGFTVRLVNNTGFRWAKLNIQYILFVTHGVRTTRATAGSALGTQTASLSIEEIKPDAETRFSTMKVDLLRESSDPVWRGSSFVKPPDTTDELRGVWLRVYDVDSTMLYEWFSSPDMVKNQSWDDLRNPSRGGRRGSSTRSAVNSSLQR